MPQPPSRRNRGADDRAGMDALAARAPASACPCFSASVWLYQRPSDRPAWVRSPGHAVAIQNAQSRAFDAGPLFGAARSVDPKESKMPKQKTKSGAKKRFKFTA